MGCGGRPRVDFRFSLASAPATLTDMPGVSGSRVPGVGAADSPSLTANLRSDHKPLRYTLIDDSLSIEQQLDASLVPPDRSLFEVALRRSLGNWIFHVPATIGVLWLSTVIVQLAVVLSALLAVLVLGSLFPSMAAVVLAAPRVLFRPFYAHGRSGYFWFLGTTVMEGLDCVVYGTCLFLLARAAGLAVSWPL